MNCGSSSAAWRRDSPFLASAWERFVLAFQCHPEVRQEDFESWLIGHANEIAAASNVSVEQLRKDTQYYGPTLAACAKQAFTDWLASVGL
jgi:GMP synthase (glutamine-hydrolysing)